MDSEGNSLRTVSSIKRATYARLLYSGRKLGPAKLSLRLRNPDESLLSSANLPAIESLMESVSCRSEGLEQEIVDALRSWRSERNDKYLKAALHRVVGSLLSRSVADQADERFEDLVRIQLETGALNPVLPMNPLAVEKTRELLGISQREAYSFLYLFRFSCLTSLLHKAKYFSDFALKTVLVVEGVANTDREDLAKDVYTRALAAGRQVLDGEAMRRTRENFPNMEFTYRPYILLVPPQLVTAFRSLLVQEKLDLLTQYRIGEQYLPKALRSVLKGEDGTFPCDLMMVTAKQMDGPSDLQHVKSLALTREDIKAVLSRALAGGSGREAEKIGDLINELIKNDPVGVSRGFWSADEPVR